MEATRTQVEPASGGTGGGVFSRQASGLTRVASGWDVFIFNVGLVSVGIAIAFNQLYGPSLYPGAQPALSTLLVVVGMIFVAVTFYFWSVIFPRSGGVYVFLSRSTHPAVAFPFSVVESVILLYYAALASSLIVGVGLSSFFATVGSIAESETLVTWAADTAEPGGIFWIGTAVLVLAGGLMMSGTRRYFTVQRVLFVVALVCTLVLGIVMLFGGVDDFRGNLTELTGLDYDEVIATAEENGYATADTSFSQSFEFLIWPLLPLLGAIQSIGIGGEVRRVRSSQLIGMLGALIATGLVIAGFALLSNKAFGYDFQGAIAFNSVSEIFDASTEGSMGAVPYFTVLAGILVDNVILATVIMAAFVAWIWFWIPAEIAYATRTMVAWSFDRMAPDKLGYVSRRFNTPVVAIGIATAVAIVFMYLIAYEEINLLTLVEALLVIWGTAMASAIVFPWTRRQFFRGSPVADLKLVGIPVMSITGLLALAFMVMAIVMLWGDPIAAGKLIDFNNLSTEFWIVFGTLAAGIAWYVGNRLYRRSRGIDTDLAFRQIPIE